MGSNDLFKNKVTSKLLLYSKKKRQEADDILQKA